MPAHAVFYKKLSSKNTRYFVGIMICVLLVVANILASQQFNPHMYGYMEGKREDQLSYLKHIWGTPLFSYEINTLKAEQNKELLAEWKKIQEQNNRHISVMEEASQTHPYSPELYYNLFLLYLENGNKTKAQEYLQKAHQIDPSI